MAALPWAVSRRAPRARRAQPVFPPLRHDDDPSYSNPILQHPLLAAGLQPQVPLGQEGTSAR